MDIDMTFGGDAYFALILSILFCFFTALAVSLFITYRLLKKYNDFGDSSCGIEEYSRFGVDYSVKRNDVNPVEKNDFFLCYAENPYENVVHSIPEQLIKNGEKAADNADNQE